MILADFLTQAKREGRVEGDTDFDAFIVDTLNELIIEAVMQERVPELRVLDFPIDLPTTDEPVDLPPDYLRMYRLRYHHFQTDKEWTLNDGSGIVEPTPKGFFGFPKFYEIVGQQIRIKPISEISDDDALTLDYYKQPDIVAVGELDTEIIPQRLTPYLMRSILARLKIYHERAQEAQFHTTDAQGAAIGFTQENRPAEESPALPQPAR